MAFLKEVSAGTPRLNQLTPAFVRLIGRPWELPADKDKGYSALAAESWLKRLGSGRTFAPPTGKVGPALALLHGSSTGPDQMAHYYLRLQLHAGQWQVDHFVVSSAALEVDLPEEEAALTAGFALQCWLAALADRQVLAPEDRAVLAAALLTPALRQQWAPPFDSDRAHGYDFNRGQLLLRLEPFSSAQRRFHLRPLDPPRHWQIEALLDKATSKRWVLMLEKMDDTPQWLITRLQETP
ncbi:MAG: hypothetical protein NZU63_11175 [Gemmataceae bacterium]|nr:hypothetical protein [Gemmataceae bacterium]MDW8243827.1 hypothetical protein [Thermogemmata sp.]